MNCIYIRDYETVLETSRKFLSENTRNIAGNKI